MTDSGTGSLLVSICHGATGVRTVPGSPSPEPPIRGLSEREEIVSEPLQDINVIEINRSSNPRPKVPNRKAPERSDETEAGNAELDDAELIEELFDLFKKRAAFITGTGLRLSFNRGQLFEQLAVSVVLRGRDMDKGNYMLIAKFPRL